MQSKAGKKRGAWISYPFNHHTTVITASPPLLRSHRKGEQHQLSSVPAPEQVPCPVSQSRVGGRDVIPTGDKGCFHFWVAELQLCQAELSHIFPSAFFPRLLQAPHISPQMTAKLHRFGKDKRGRKGKHPVGQTGKPLPKELSNSVCSDTNSTSLEEQELTCCCPGSQLSSPAGTALRATGRTHSPDHEEQRAAPCNSCFL